jgi:hypothetical protein
MKKALYLLLFLSFALSVASCWDDSEALEAIPSKDLLRTNNIEIEGTCTEAILHIEANCHWTLSVESGHEDGQWLTLSAIQGYGTADIQLATSQNQQPQERTATIRITTDAGIVRRITVSQKGIIGNIPGNGDNERPIF